MTNKRLQLWYEIFYFSNHPFNNCLKFLLQQQYKTFKKLWSKSYAALAGKFRRGEEKYIKKNCLVKYIASNKNALPFNIIIKNLLQHTFCGNITELLTHIMQLVSFYTLRKQYKTSGFQMFSGGITTYSQFRGIFSVGNFQLTPPFLNFTTLPGI